MATWYCRGCGWAGMDLDPCPECGDIYAVLTPKVVCP